MKIVGILGSARRRGNTEALLDVALEEAEENGVLVSKIRAEKKVVAPCNGCLKCRETGRCVIKDDMREIYKGMLESDGILWATPVYFWSMSGQIKIVMDRTYSLTFPRLQLANKVGGLIVVAASRGCMSVTNVFNTYFNYNHMFSAEPAYCYAFEKGEVEKNPLAINMVKEMVHQMISLIQSAPKFPEAFDLPLSRFVREKYHL
jgi:multimeric flavodoxin WrbA